MSFVNSKNILNLIYIKANYKNKNDCFFTTFSSDLTIEKEGENLKIPKPHKESLLLHNNKDFSNIYRLTGTIDMYFNFEFGVVALIDSTNNLSLKYEKQVY